MFDMVRTSGKQQKRQKILLCAAFDSIGSARLCFADFSHLIVRCIAGAEGIK
jgi:hypothetical protein